MLTPASQTALACAARVDMKRERKAILITESDVAIRLASKGKRIVIQSRSSKQEEKVAEYIPIPIIPPRSSYAYTSVT
jgi:hypothetical protein